MVGLYNYDYDRLVISDNFKKQFQATVISRQLLNTAEF